MSIVLSVHPGVQIAYELYDLYPGGQQKTFLPFGHGRDLVALTVRLIEQVFLGSGRDK